MHALRGLADSHFCAFLDQSDTGLLLVSYSPGRVDSGISVRGDVALTPDSIGQTSSESSGGRDAFAARVSTIAASATPASVAKVRYQSQIWIYLPQTMQEIQD